MPGVTRLLATAAPRARFVGFAEDPEIYLAASDVLCLPSYREGFGSAVLEAAAAGLPTIGSRIYGLTDAIVDEHTGLLVPPRDPLALAGAMARLANDARLRCALGAAARERALRDFGSTAVCGALFAYYADALRAAAASRA